MRNIRYTVPHQPNLFVQIVGAILGIGLFALAIVIGGFLLAGLAGSRFNRVAGDIDPDMVVDAKG